MYQVRGLIEKYDRENPFWLLFCIVLIHVSNEIGCGYQIDLLVNYSTWMTCKLFSKNNNDLEG